jgi:UDP-N-acetylmuramate dehydrogenase
MIDLRQDVDLLNLHTFATPARAEYLTEISSTEDASEVAAHLKTHPTETLVLGGGSNVLFRKNVDGLVILNRIKGIEQVGETDSHYLVAVGAGENWHSFVEHCIGQQWCGVENLALIPGNVGASPMQNIGAYGVELESVFDHLEAVELTTGEVHQFSKDDCRFGYRESIFKKAPHKGRYIITKVIFRLRKQPDLNTSYGAIEQELERMGVSELNIRSVADAVIRIRQSKLPDPKKIGNAGSFFKNPVIDETHFQRFHAAHPDAPNYPAGEGMYKLAAGWLIDQAGWKGHREGPIGVHDRQALVLVNHGGGKGGDVYALSQRILEDVEVKFGVTLEREVNVI